MRKIYGAIISWLLSKREKAHSTDTGKYTEN